MHQRRSGHCRVVLLDAGSGRKFDSSFDLGMGVCSAVNA